MWHNKFSPMQVISLYLIYEKSLGESSFWAPYLNSLPVTYTNAPYWEDSDILLLPERFRSSFRDHNTALAKSYEKLFPLAKDLQKHWPAFDTFSYDTYRWAWSTINTRSVYMRQTKNHYLMDEEDHYALAPFLDLLNHSADVEVIISVFLNSIIPFSILFSY